MRVTATPDGITIAVSDVHSRAWRVGFHPRPWDWAPWDYATDGRFDGRWDDPHGRWRTLYLADSRRGCYLEVLAHFRADPTLEAEFDDIDDDDDAHPTIAAGTVPPEWRKKRAIGSATLDGVFAVPSAAETLSQLRPVFLPMTLDLGIPDLDAAAMRLCEPRALTQAVAAWLYALPVEGNGVDGVEFRSRHDDHAVMWALFERAPGISPCLSDQSGRPIDWEDPDLVDAMRLHRLVWADA